MKGQLTKLGWDSLEARLDGFYRLVFYVILFHVLLAVYWPAMKSPFVYDDLPNIVYNADLRLPGEFWRAFARHDTSMQFDQRPVAGLLTLINYQLCGLNPMGFHLVNLLIHWATAIVLCEFIISFGRATALPKARMAACATTALWALHPLNSVSVIFISQRMESLMAFFYLVTLWSFLRSMEEPRPAFWLLGSGASFVACLASKEVGLTLIVAIPLLLMVVSGSRWRLALQAQGWYFAGLSAVWIAFVVWWADGPRIEEVEGGILGHPWVYFTAQCRYVVAYLCLVFWPHPLSFTYTSVYPDRLLAWLPHAFLLAAVAGAVFVLARRRRWVLLPGVLFFVILAPTSSFLPIPREPAAEWRMYLPAACIIALAVALTGGASERFKRAYSGVLTILLVLVIAFSIATNQRAAVYASPVSLWADTVQKQPGNYTALANLAMVRISVRQHDAARAEARALISYGERFDDHRTQGTGWQIMGMIDADARQFKDALLHYQRAVALDPALLGIHAQISYVLLQLEQLHLAVEHSAKALATNPQDPFTILIAADAYWRAGMEAQARDLFARASIISRDEPGFKAVQSRIEGTKLPEAKQLK